ncbi:MAG: endonuclease/exonuclease/phosphatase family protein [Desulfobacteraceae bacterium]|nr:endonuclease/exonuclease/phosphatase family protein [Desulfobacteraceae bacterium]
MSAKPHHKTPAWLLSLGFTYLVVLAALTLLNCTGADRWWFGAFNLYLPQVIWAIPGIVVAAISVKVAWRWVWLPLLGIVWVAGPLMGFCWPLPAAHVQPAGPPLRVMTWNVKYGTHDTLAHMAIMYEIERNRPSVVLLQDADGVMNGVLGDYLSTWNIRSVGQYVIASKLPLGALQVRNLSYPGNGHTCVRTELQYNGTVVVLYNVHFESPREGLYSMRVAKENPEHLPKAIQKLEDNVRARLAQARTVREFLRKESGPIILAGDLNSPEASQAFLTLREAGLHDAFAEGGKGYGYTYGHFLLRNRFPLLTASWMRIDHIMMSSQFQTRKCWIGTGRASDHRPVIADLVLDHR